MDDQVDFTDIYVDDEIIESVSSVMENTRYVKGPILEAFEEEFAEFVGTEYAVGVSSGTAALLLSMEAADIGPGDSVVLPAHSYFATASPVIKLGAEPIFVNVDEATYTIDTEAIADVVKSRDDVAAVAPVHLYGHPAKMDELTDIATKHDLTVIEDCSQAHGATFDGQKVGSFGDAGCFSFYPSKNMTVGGDGGIITTDREEIATAARELRNHGRNEDGEHVRLGLNYRLDEVNAAVGRKQLTHLETWSEKRRANAHKYTERLEGIKQVTQPSEIGPIEHVYHLYVIRVADRNALRAYLDENGVDTGIHYENALHRQPAIAERIPEQSSLERTERLCDEVLSLPMHPRMDPEEIATVCDYIEQYYRGGAE